MDIVVLILTIIGIFLIIPFIPILHELFRIPLGLLSLLLGKYAWITFYLFWFMRPKHVFQDTQESFHKSTKLPVQTLEELKQSLQTGDLIFNVTKNNLGPFVGMKWGANSPVSHSAIVVMEQNTPWIFEAVTSGVRFIPLEEALFRYNSDVVFFRHLLGKRNEDFIEIIEKYIQKRIGEPHEFSHLSGPWEMIKAAIDPKVPFTNRDLVQNTRNPGLLFCSELVAEVYMMLGIIPDDLDNQFPDSNEYIPADFTNFNYKQSQESKIFNNLLNDYSLTNEILLSYNLEKIRRDWYSITLLK